MDGILCHSYIYSATLLCKTPISSPSPYSLYAYIQATHSPSSCLLRQIVRNLRRKQTTFSHIYTATFLYETPFPSPSPYSLYAYIQVTYSSSSCLLRQIFRDFRRKQTTVSHIYTATFLYETSFPSPFLYSLFGYIQVTHSQSSYLP
jgi:hypothetical protein